MIKKIGELSKTRFGRVIHEMFRMFFGKHVMRNSASLAYWLTMSIFPLLLCATAILGQLEFDNHDMSYIWGEIAPSAAALVIDDFLQYVSGNMSSVMMAIGIATMLTTSSAALRTIMGVMGDLQGERRFHGLFGQLASFLLSLGFLAAIYASGLIIMTGEWFISFVESHLNIAFSTGWLWLRFILLFAVMFSIILGIYLVASPKKTRLKMRLPGAFTSAVLLVVVSMIFSQIISASTKYTVVYGSLASIIILMVWMYACSTIIIMGNVFNLALAKNMKPAQ